MIPVSLRWHGNAAGHPDAGHLELIDQTLAELVRLKPASAVLIGPAENLTLIIRSCLAIAGDPEATINADMLPSEVGTMVPTTPSGAGGEKLMSLPLREAREETGVDPARLHPLATLERMFIPPSGFHVVPVLAYSPDPGPVAVVDSSETATVARVPLRALINPRNRLMVCRTAGERRYAGPAFLLNEMLVWGFTGHVISAMLDVAGWAQPWNTDDVVELDDAMALVGADSKEPL
jgi:ADP-ribose pyrophosphatase YjhB (NUDIX family)